MRLFYPRGRPLSDRYKTITPLPLRRNISTAVRLAQQMLSAPSPPTIDDTQKLATWVDTKNDDENLHRRLRALSAETLFAIAVLDSEAWRKVKTFAKQGIPGRYIPTADDLVSKLPLELVLSLIALLPLKERVRFSQTSHRNNGLCALLLHHETSSLLATFGLGVSEVQLMLLGSRTLLSGFSIPFLLHIDDPFPVYKLELYTAFTKGEDVATYICRMGGYILDDDIFQEEIDGLLNASWVLRKGSKTITVIESMTTAGACIFNLHATPEMGFWDGNRIFHAYPTLLTTGVSLTTPRLLELDYTLQAQRHVWHVLQKYSLRGFQHQFEYKAVHVCVTPELNLGTEMALYPGCALRLYRNNAGTPLTTLVTGTVADVVEHGTGISLLILIANIKMQAPISRCMFLQQVISLNATMREEQQKESRGVFHDEEWSEEHNKTYDGTIYVRMSDITTIVDIDLSLPDMQGYIPFEQEIQNALITGPALHYLSPGCQVIFDHVEDTARGYDELTD
ncbi:hypothetical protein B0H11DRAFT_2237532 [Mycena galericulata]|nr:hypothetical protein B0H11DRAFT_2237532 [Mycena galericulata]